MLVGCYQPNATTGAPCSSNQRCPDDQICDLQQAPPICVGSLGDGGVEPPDATPITCVDSTGCPAAAPVCDNSVCRGCLADVECSSDVCHELAGTCVAEAATIYVAINGATTGSCPRTQPCASIEHALDQVSAFRTTIKLGDGSYPEDVKLDGSGLPILLSGTDALPAGATLTGNLGQVVDLVSSSNGVLEGVTITSGSTAVVTRGNLTLYRVEVAGAKLGIDMRQGFLRVLESRIAGSADQGISAQGGSFELERSFVVGNAGGGIEVGTATATIVNTVLTDNGSTTSSFGGIKFATIGAYAFEFNTVSRNVATSAAAAGVQCTQLVSIESSIVATNGPGPQISPTCTARFSLFFPSGPSQGTNIIGAPLFDNAINGHHIQASSPARDAADPAATERIDIDGDSRPGGARRDIGADEIP